MAEKKDKKEKCPLCEVSEETLQRLKGGEKRKEEKKDGESRASKEK